MKKLRIILLSFLTLFFFSCEIGLGSSVDTDPPELKILTPNPERDSIIRDKFALSGSWSDDGTIASVTAQLKKMDGSDTVYDYVCNFTLNSEKSNNGTWTTIINPFDEEGNKIISDGTYQAVVTIKDSVDRTTVQSTSFTIDNTPPVIVLTRPSTDVDSASSDTYGQTFNLEGQAADTNNVSLIEVKIYKDKDCTEHIHTVPLYNVPNSINMDVAKFASDDPTLSEHYYTIYGGNTTDGGAKDFYCRIVAYDGSQRYPIDGEQSAEDLKGNPVDYYYLYSDIATSVLQTYKITEVYSMLSGTYKEDTSARAVQPADILSTLSKSKKTEGKFTLNPKNNPTFTVSGRNPLVRNEETSFYTFTENENISNDGKVVIEVNPGLDGYLINKESLKVYAVSYSNNHGIISKPQYINFDNIEAQISGTSYKYTIPIRLDDGFVIGTNYLFVVEGFDEGPAHNKIEPAAEAYGFHMSSSGRSPILSVTEPANTNTYIARNGSVTFTGTVSVEYGEPVVRIYKNGEVLADKLKLTAVKENPDSSDLKYSFTYTAGDFGNSSAQFPFKIETELDGAKTVVEKNVVYDYDAPNIDILNTSPVLSKIAKFEDNGTQVGPSSSYLNGNVSFKFSIVDDYDVVAEGGATWQTQIVTEDETGNIIVSSEGTAQVITSPSQAEFTINTTDFSDNTKIRLKMLAKDRAGNVNEKFWPTDKPYYIIDQTTDTPRVFLIKDDNTFAGLSLFNSCENAKKLPVGTKLSFKIYEDDGNATLSLKQSKEGVPQNTNADEFLGANGQDESKWLTYDTTVSSDSNFEYSVGKNTGYYIYIVSIKDILGKTNDETAFFIKVTNAAISIETITQNATYVNEKMQVSNAIKIQASEAPYTLLRTINPDTDNEVKDTITISDTDVINNIYTDSFNVKDDAGEKLIAGENVINYTITDNEGYSSTATIKVVRDDTRPLPVITTPENDNKHRKENAIKETSYKFAGSVSDSSGTEKIYYKFNKAGSPEPTPVSTGADGRGALTSTNWTNAGFTEAVLSGNKWYFYQGFTSGTEDSNGKLAEGLNYTLYIFAVDKAGNVSEDSKRIFDVDLTEPKVESITGVKNTYLVSDTNENAGSFTLNVDARDTFGLDKVFVSYDAATLANPIELIQDGNAYKKTFTFGSAATNTDNSVILADGYYNFHITAKDKAGRIDDKDVEFTIDTVLPEIENLKINDLAYDKNRWFGSQAVTVKLNASDNGAGNQSGVASVEYTTDSAKQTWTPLISGEGTVSFGQAGTNKFYLRVKDKAGNINEYNSGESDNSIIVQIDGTPPEFGILFDSINRSSESVAYINTSTESVVYYGKYKDPESGVGELSVKLENQYATVSYLTGEWTETYDALSTASVQITNDEGNQESVSAYKNFDEITDKSKITYWKAEFTKAKLSGESGVFKQGDATKNISISGSSSAGNISDSSRRICMDNEAPKLNNISVKSQTDKGVYKYAKTTSENNVETSASYYISSIVGTTFTIAGSVSDNQGVRNVICASAGDTDQTTISDSLDFTLVPPAAEGNIKTLTLTATDKAGNTALYTLNITLDNAAPASQHLFDARNQDLYFRIGNNDNKIIATDTDKDVGGKYSSLTYGNSETIKIRGKFNDSTSGADLVYYKVFHTLPGQSESFYTNYEAEADGSFSILQDDKILKKRVFFVQSYTKQGDTTPTTVTIEGAESDGTNYYLDNVESNYYATISGLTAGENYLVLIAVDKVGNAKVDTITVPEEGSVNNYRLNVDTEGPDISTDNDAIKYSNGTQSFEITGKVSDNPAGVESIEVYANILKAKNSNDKKKITFTVGLEDNGSAHPIVTPDISDDIKNERYKKWTATVDTSKLKYDDDTVYDGTVSIYAAAKDKAGAGNTSTISIGTIIMDTKGPTVTINPINDADKYTEGTQVNGLINISGTATDEKGLAAGDTIKLLYSYSEDGDYTEFSTSSSGTSWRFDNINVDTLKQDSLAAEASQDLWFKVSSEDVAGNVGESEPVKVIIDPQSDRPVIEFTNGLIVKSDIKNDDTNNKRSWITNAQVRGTVNDDDGVSEVYYSFDNSTWSENCYTPGTKEFVINLPADGSVDDKHTLYFKVKEVGTNKEYTSNSVTTAADALTTPKILCKNTTTETNEILNNSAGKYDSVLYINIDLVYPTLQVLAYTFDDCSAVTDLYDIIVNENGIINTDTISWTPLTSNIKTGGPANKLYILASAFDANKIESVVLKDGSNIVTAKKEEVFGTNDTRKAALYEIDIAEVTTDEKSFTVEVKDRAKKEITPRYNPISIDRVGPTVTINSPVENDTVYGNDGVADNRVKIMGSADDSHCGNNGIGKVWLAITKSESDSPKTEDASDAKECEKYFDISTQNVSAIVATFNGNIDDENNGKTERYLELFNYYVNELYGQGTSYNTDRKDICLWIKAEDTLGNVGEPFKLPLTILTQGDKPEVKITYPTQNSTKGGAFTLTGSTSIGTDTVDKVYVQIDPDYGTSFATDWKSKMEAIMSGKTGLGYSIVPTGRSETGYEYAIEAQGTPESWYLTLNMLNEFNKTENGKLTNSTIGIRVFAVGKDNHKLSALKELQFTLDPGSPIFGNANKMRLVQYADNEHGTGAETASLLYSDNIWLKGKWWLTGSVEDDSGIDILTLVGSGTATSQNLLSGYATKITGSDKDNYVINVPVGDGFFGPTFTINAKEKDGSNTSPYNVKLQFDGEAPEFSANLAEAGNSIVQSQGTYQIDGTFNDGQGSGFNRIVFYIKRTIGDKDYLTDVMSRQGTTTGVPENCFPVSDFAEPASGKDLYWKKSENCTANNTQITLSSDIPAYVHAGSICRINNVIYLIKSTNLGAKTIMLDKQLASGTVSVEFTVAHVIDNTVSETGVTTYYGDTTNIIANDDHDEMVESYTSSSGKWTVAINSQNIKDGVIKMHFVAFDTAGNATPKEYEGTVANNRPRIAGVKFGSDTNGNEKVDEATETSDYTEMKTMYVGLYNSSSANKVENVSVNGQAPNGNKIYELAIPNNGVDIKKLSGNPVLTVKGKVKIVPEVVGGNDGLSWTYCVGEKDDNKIVTETVTENGESVSRRKITQMASTHSDDIRAEETPIELSVADLISALGTSCDGEKDFFFQIWDHTAGTEIGYSSNRADLALRFYIALKDGVAPTASIKPFYWKDSENNSLVYEGSGSERKAKGHIELEADLPQETFTESSGELDKDPKVSGEIYLEGTAKDNVAVDEIWLKFEGLTSNTETNDFILVAKRDNGAWENKSETDGITFISADDFTETENGQDYNIVNWKIKLDTAKISDTADVDKKIQIMVKDRGGVKVNSDGTLGKNVPSSSDVSENQTAIPAVTWGDAKVTQNVQFYLDWDLTKPVTNKIGSTLVDETIVYQDNRTPTYKVDVVPYITVVRTSLSSLKNNNPSVYSRTAKGHYSVRSDENVTLEGFNLGTNTSLNISSITKSGDYSFKINNVESLNNKNNDDAKGLNTKTVDLTKNPTGDKTVYDNYYNRQPNGDNNNLLTDNITFDVWQITPEAVKPKVGAATSPVMAINPHNHDVGFAFVNGTLYFSMPNGNTNSYDYWLGGIDIWTSVSLAYDKYGNSYGTAAGGDINSAKADQFRIMTSRWGRGGLYYDAYNDGRNQFRLELIGQRDFEGSGTSYTGYNTFDKERIKSPSMATTASSDAKTTVYMAYYDAINDEIRFKWGNFTDSRRGDSESELMGDYYGLNEFKYEDGNYAKNPDNKKCDKGDGGDSEAGGKELDKAYGVYRTVHNSLIAGQTERVVKGDGTKTSAKVITTANNPVYAGKYVSIAAIEGGGTNDDAVVAVWWDGTNNQLLYSYNKTPKSITAGKYKQADTKWSTPVRVFGPGIGEYCKVVTDAKGHVHIAAFDGSNGDVWYAYLDDFETTDNIKTCIVDSYGIIGTRLNIDVALDSNEKPVPYISYYSATRPKIAYWAASQSLDSETIAEGSREDAFTGNWEVSYIPTSSKFSDSNICVGVWKDDDGKLNYSTTDGNEPTESNIGTNSFTPGQAATSHSDGTVWGNGSKNAIVGYATISGGTGYIETAQMR